MKKFLMIHGYGHDQMGKTPNGAHGTVTVEELNALLQEKANQIGVEVEAFQSNDVEQVVEKIQAAAKSGVSGILFNPATWMTNGERIAEVLATVHVPVVEVHMGHIHKKGGEKNVIAPYVTGMATGFGKWVYPAALEMLSLFVEVQ